ncbi:hypothetical protein QFC19_007389 [Naganishia cerealis]|uniref:Uncharacterized protein n=1 Tax=Naganishia cerealis TaxID=610337 RepID=A0ACC2V9W2_9TREE|nr:hypothetical protein QFC19_007389 [Naganishia cerealis]
MIINYRPESGLAFPSVCPSAVKPPADAVLVSKMDFDSCDESAPESQGSVMSELVDDVPLLVSDSEEDEAENEVTKSGVENENNEKNSTRLKQERDQVMTVIVKYIVAKIKNSFPPEQASRIDGSLPLDKFLLILTSRLQVSLVEFMKSIIYLFRYMDIVYLLRYLNQCNNMANYNGMDFTLRKLIVGCFKLALTRDRIVRDFPQITGLSNQEISAVTRKIISRMNGKVSIKDTEVLRMKLELYRFVRMVSTVY